MESREALVEALTEYSGAVILVSHDMHLLGLVADRLWLVKDGAVHALYRGSGGLSPPASCGRRAGAREARCREAEAISRDEMLALRAEVRKCEERLAKLNDMRDRSGQEAGRSRALRAGARGRTGDLAEEIRRGDGRAGPGRGAVAQGRSAPGRGGRLMDTAFLITAFVTLFVVIDPPGLIPLFIALTQGMTADAPPRHRPARLLHRGDPADAVRPLRRGGAGLRRHLDARLPHRGGHPAVPDRARHAVRAAHPAARGAEDRPAARPVGLSAGDAADRRTGGHRLDDPAGRPVGAGLGGDAGGAWADAGPDRDLLCAVPRRRARSNARSAGPGPS